MRQIKFRVWNTKSKAWCTDSFVQSNFFNLQKESMQDEYITMQFTGLLDKNGIEIYEGDILHFNTLSGNNMYYEVKWKGTGFKPTRMSEHNKSEMEIIGNVWENPELLTN